MERQGGADAVDRGRQGRGASVIPDLGAFAGRWQLRRRIADRLAGRDGTLTGHAVFVPQGDTARYEEIGVLRFPGMAPLHASRRYLWRRTQGGIAVLFEGGQPFHRIDAAAQDRHWCDPDTYDVCYRFEDWPEGWSTVWEVRGPRKNYRMESDYRR